MPKIKTNLILCRHWPVSDESCRQACLMARLKFRQIQARSLAIANRPCDCSVGQFLPYITGRRYFADNIGLSSTTIT